VRLASVVEGALDQIPPSALGVVVVEIGEPIDVDVLTDVLSKRTAERPVFFSTLVFVVVRWTVNVALRPVAAGAILHGRALTKAELRLAHVLLGPAP
jgi:hypothetical protein